MKTAALHDTIRSSTITPTSVDASESIKTATTKNSELTYARGRLLIGITCVGWIVVATCLTLISRLPSLTLSGVGTALPSTFVELFLFFGIVSFFLFPFEFAGGYLLPRAYRRVPSGMKQFLTRLGRASFLHVLLYALLGTAIIATARSVGPFVAFLLFPVFGFLQLALQGTLCSLFTPVQNRSPLSSRHDFVPVEFVSDPGESFTGGIIGLPGNEKIIIPERWIASFSDQELAIMIARRRIAILSGARIKGIMVSMVWMISGIALSLLPHESSLMSASGLTTMSLWFTLWSFIGLLLLPSLSRAGVHFVDEKTTDGDANGETLQTALVKADELGDTEYERSRLVESVFHPIPSPMRRIQALSGDITSRRLPTWNVNRLTLFLSWSGLSLLSRSVHCNCGRPHLWILLPVD